MRRDIRLLMQEIIAAMDAIERFVQGIASAGDLQADDKTASAVIRKLEVIGEAARSLPADFRDRHREIPWKKMIGMRDRLIHGYFAVDYSLVWETVKQDIPEIKSLLKKMLAELPAEPDK